MQSNTPNPQNTQLIPSEISLQTPFATKSKFSALTGLSEDTIRSLIQRGSLPSIKVGRHRLVNVALITQSALDS